MRMGMSSKVKLAIVLPCLILILLTASVLLDYFDIPAYMVMIFASVIGIATLSMLVAHIWIVTVKGLRVYDGYFIPPHPGLHAIMDGGPKAIPFKEVEIAFLHCSEAGNRAQLRIKLVGGRSIALRHGDLGISAGSFKTLVREMELRHKLDAADFRSCQVSPFPPAGSFGIFFI
jgi:hypothetical protein